MFRHNTVNVKESTVFDKCLLHLSENTTEVIQPQRGSCSLQVFHLCTFCAGSHSTHGSSVGFFFRLPLGCWLLPYSWCSAVLTCWSPAAEQASWPPRTGREEAERHCERFLEISGSIRLRESSLCQ